MAFEWQVRRLAELFLGRASDYAVQLPTGRYRRVGRPVSLDVLRAHLQGVWTIGTYVQDEQGRCVFAVLDADQDNGLVMLTEVQNCLAGESVPSFLEASRRGGHLWLFFEASLPARVVRAWLGPWCPAGVECYPKQDESAGYGSLIRVPLGVHQRSGKRYPFVVRQGGRLVPLASTLEATLAVLGHVERIPEARVYTASTHPSPVSTSRSPRTHQSPTLSLSGAPRGVEASGIARWCADQEPFALIGRYVRLDQRGVGPCPFPDHHAAGRDRHPSFQVFAPRHPGGTCWRCYTGEISGNVFNFVQRYHGWDAKELWTRLCRGEMF